MPGRFLTMILIIPYRYTAYNYFKNSKNWETNRSEWMVFKGLFVQINHLCFWLVFYGNKSLKTKAYVIKSCHNFIPVLLMTMEELSMEWQLYSK